MIANNAADCHIALHWDSTTSNKGAFYMSVGGDGSQIEVARTLWKRDVPILGINMGTLGYLTEVEVNNLEEDITQMLQGDYLYEERMMLEGTFQDGKKDVALTQESPSN